MKYILHFDINKTVVMADAASGADVEAMLNSIISESVWGSYNSSCGDNEWKMHSPEPSRDPVDASHVTYGEYLEDIAKANRPTRKHLKGHFTSLVAPECASSYAHLVQCMTDTSSTHPSMYHIVPSFFHFLDVLQERNIDYEIVFRTFGVDTEPVMDEFNRFCNGSHPLTKQGTNHISRQISPGNTGELRRRGENPQDMQLSLKSGQVICGATAIGGFLAAAAETLILQDDFEWWRDHNESDDSGKLLLIDEEDPNITQIFFDDNIERTRAHIVDVRNKDYVAIPFHRSKDTILRRVYPYGAITDLEYYVKEFDDICCLLREKSVQNSVAK